MIAVVSSDFHMFTAMNIYSCDFCGLLHVEV